MSMYFVGIDISKYKHDCCIISAADQKVVSKVTIKNNKSGFNELLTIINSLSNPEDIRIGFESTAHYALNLELSLENSLLTFMEVNPVLISEYKKSKTLRRTKTDSVDCESIARWLMTVEYKPHSKGFYHAYSLKSLTRLRDKLIRQRSFYLRLDVDGFFANKNEVIVVVGYSYKPCPTRRQSLLRRGLAPYKKEIARLVCEQVHTSRSISFLHGL